ncbi:transposable element Tcb1 transposase [Trichonephila clavipes]|nr:transposable element Tcb1 transposase [Trichonephila clavipes]
MICHRIRAHYEQLSEFERGCFIRLKEAGWENRRIARHMGRSDTAIRSCWQEWVDSGRFQCHDDGWKSKFYAHNDHYAPCHSRLCTVEPDYSGSWPEQIQLAAQRFVDDILRTVLLPFAVPGHIFQQDNIKPHTSRVAMNRLTACQTLPWPAISPNLPPIEHVCNMMGRQLHLPGNTDDLPRQLNQKNLERNTP